MKNRAKKKKKNDIHSSFVSSLGQTDITKIFSLHIHTYIHRYVYVTHPGVVLDAIYYFIGFIYLTKKKSHEHFCQ